MNYETHKKKTEEPDFVGFVLWPVIGGIMGVLVVTILFLQRVTDGNPSFGILMLFAIEGAVLAASTWAGRTQPQCFPLLWSMTITCGLLLCGFNPLRVRVTSHRNTFAFEEELAYLMMDLITCAIGSVVAAFYSLFRWSNSSNEALLR